MDASLDLINAAFAKLRATPALMSIVTGIYDEVPRQQDGSPNVASPYVSLGPSDSTSEDYDPGASGTSGDAEGISFQIDAWSWGAGEAFSTAEVRKIAALIRKTLHHAELELAENSLVTIVHEVTRILKDPDGTTRHAAIQFSAVVDIP